MVKVEAFEAATFVLPKARTKGSLGRDQEQSLVENSMNLRNSTARLAIRQRERPGSNQKFTHGRLDNSQQLSSLSWGRGPTL